MIGLNKLTSINRLDNEVRVSPRTKYVAVTLDVDDFISSNDDTTRIMLDKSDHRRSLYRKNTNTMQNPNSMNNIPNRSSMSVVNGLKNKYVPDDGYACKKVKSGHVLSLSFESTKKIKNNSLDKINVKTIDDIYDKQKQYNTHIRSNSVPVTNRDKLEILLNIKNLYMNKLNKLILQMQPSIFKKNQIEPPNSVRETKSLFADHGVKLDDLSSNRNNISNEPTIRNITPRLMSNKTYISNDINVYNPIKYYKITEIAFPLDIIAFNDQKNDDITFNHIGIVVNRDILPNFKMLKPGKLYILESFISYRLPELNCGQYEPSNRNNYIQIRDLDKVYGIISKDADSPMAIATLMYNPWISKTFSSTITLNEQKKYIINTMNDILKKYTKPEFKKNKLTVVRRQSLAVIFNKKSKSKDKIVKKDSISTQNLPDDIVFSTLTPENINLKTIFSYDLICILYQKFGIISTMIDVKTTTVMDLFSFDKNRNPSIIQSIRYFDKSK